MPALKKFLKQAVLAAILLILTGACSEKSGRPELTVWFHSAQPGERAVLLDQIQRFNAGQADFRVRATMIPEGAYNGQVQAAAVAGDLPDVLEFDGPYVYNYVWQQLLIPIGARLRPGIKNDLLPSIIRQGMFRGRFYSVGTYDSGLGLYARKSKLVEAGIRIPDGPEDAWTADEFEMLLAALAEIDPDGRVLDLKLNYSGEYFTYAISPVLWSAGAGLVDREETLHADGVLNSPEAVRAMSHVQSWFNHRYVDRNLDDAAFTQGRVALSWVGHWEYDRYYAAWEEDLVVVPLPDFGVGTRTGQGSWNWGISRNCEHPAHAVRFLEFLLRPEEILAMCEANSAVPARRAALKRSELYGKNGPLRLFAEQLTRDFAVPRPRTPAYPVISSVFSAAFLYIRDGADVKTVLDEASAAIDRDIAYNKGYPMP